jgi:hypothetical protein
MCTTRGPRIDVREQRCRFLGPGRRSASEMVSFGEYALGTPGETEARRATVNRSTVPSSPLQAPSAHRSHAGGRWFDPSRAHRSTKPILAFWPGSERAVGERNGEYGAPEPSSWSAEAGNDRGHRCSNAGSQSRRIGSSVHEVSLRGQQPPGRPKEPRPEDGSSTVPGWL